MAPTVKDLISTAVTAAQNQATAQTATRAAVAQIASQRPAEGPAMANSAGTPEAGPQ